MGLLIKKKNFEPSLGKKVHAFQESKSVVNLMQWEEINQNSDDTKY